MKLCLGTLKKGDEVLFEDVGVWVGTTESPTGQKSWLGALGQMHSIFFDEEGPYDLILVDGRAGKIRIKNLDSLDSGFVEFEGVGDLD